MGSTCYLDKNATHFRSLVILRLCPGSITTKTTLSFTASILMVPAFGANQERAYLHLLERRK